LRRIVIFWLDGAFGEHSDAFRARICSSVLQARCRGRDLFVKAGVGRDQLTRHHALERGRELAGKLGKQLDVLLVRLFLLRRSLDLRFGGGVEDGESVGVGVWADLRPAQDGSSLPG
jgi:hypothetical protein